MGFMAGFGPALFESTEREKQATEQRKAHERAARLEYAQILLMSPDPSKKAMGLAILADPDANIDPSKIGQHPGAEMAQNILKTMGSGPAAKAAITSGQPGMAASLGGGNAFTDIGGMPSAPTPGTGGGVGAGPGQNMSPAPGPTSGPTPPPPLPPDAAAQTTAPAMNAGNGSPINPAATAAAPDPMAAVNALIADRRTPMPYPASDSPAASAAYTAETMRRNEAANTMEALSKGDIDPNDIAATGVGGGAQLGLSLRKRETQAGKDKDRTLRLELANKTIAASRERMNTQFENAKSLISQRFGNAKALQATHEGAVNARSELARKMGMTRTQLEQQGAIMRGFERQIGGVQARHEQELARLTATHNSHPDLLSDDEFQQAVQGLEGRTKKELGDLTSQVQSMQDAMGGTVDNAPTLTAPTTRGSKGLVGTEVMPGFKVVGVR